MFLVSPTHAVAAESHVTLALLGHTLSVSNAIARKQMGGIRLHCSIGDIPIFRPASDGALFIRRPCVNLRKELLLSLWLRSELLGRGAPSLLTCGGGRLPAAA